MLLQCVETRDGTVDVSADLGMCVVLMGLPPLVAQGLQVCLSATGLQCTVQTMTGEITAPPAPGSTVVAVLPAEASLTVDVAQAHGFQLSVVRVLAQASVQAYSDALRAGATGAFASDAELADIVRIVLSAGSGFTVLPVDVARALNRPSTGPRPQLTSRELQYLRMLADGATVASLARRFAHSERETYRLLSAVYTRLGAANRTEALLLAQRFDLLDEQD